VTEQEDVPLQFELYREQIRHWPTEGRHVLAQHDAESIIVYQAFRPEIARHAVEHRALGGEGFSYSRMSWIKPNFLWIMYRSGWATKPDQEAVLALRISRTFFDALLSRAVASTFDPDRFGSQDEWQDAVSQSSVRLQWDPDHDPRGVPQRRRAVQLGLRGDTLAQFGQREIIEVVDVSSVVAEQRQRLATDPASLRIPRERVYGPAGETAAANIGLSTPPPE
jgi:hypothetical protein